MTKAPLEKYVVLGGVAHASRWVTQYPDDEIAYELNDGSLHRYVLRDLGAGARGYVWDQMPLKQAIALYPIAEVLFSVADASEATGAALLEGMGRIVRIWSSQHNQP